MIEPVPGADPLVSSVSSVEWEELESTEVFSEVGFKGGRLCGVG